MEYSEATKDAVKAFEQVLRKEKELENAKALLEWYVKRVPKNEMRAYVEDTEKLREKSD